jgi:hypothetical protein
MRVWSAAAAALAVVSLCAACGERTQPIATGDDGEGAVPARVRGNQLVFSAKQSHALLAWAGRFRECVSERGLRTSVNVTRREISMRVAGTAPLSTLLRVGAACGDSLGGPPARASLQVFDNLLVLYLPKRCLLDAKVAAKYA